MQRLLYFPLCLSRNLNGGELRLLSETHNPPAGRNGSSPPNPAAPRGRRPPASPERRADCAAAAQTAKGLGSSEEQRHRKVHKGREALQRFRATKDAKDRGAPGVAAHRFRATLEGRDNITGREPSHSRCGGANFDGNLGRPASIRRVLNGANRVLHRTLLRWNTTTTVLTISLPTLLNPRWLDDSMRTLTLSLPLLNPISSCDSRQDEDGIHRDPSCPLNHKSKSARKREKQQAKKQERV
jgi:hypothetical protein